MQNIIFSCCCLLLFAGCSQDPQLNENLQDSENFLSSNLLQEGVTEIEPGLQYSVISSGDPAAEPAKLSDTITAHFHGTLKDGAVFWSSVNMGEPLIINLSQLIPGCQKAISMMRPGDKWNVFIHPDLAYGEEGRPTIPPNAALVFDIELIKVDA